MEQNGHNQEAQPVLGKFFYVKPEMAGGFGSNTVIDSGAQPPAVTQLHFEINKWLGDDLLEANANFIVTDRLALKIRSAKVSGCVLSKVEISMSEEFLKQYPGTKLPDFLWLKIVGKAGQNDFGMAGEHLVVSEQGIAALKSWNLEHATVSDYVNGIGEKIAPVLPAAPIVPLPLPEGANDQALVVTDMAGSFCKAGTEQPAPASNVSSNSAQEAASSVPAAKSEEKVSPAKEARKSLPKSGVKRKKTLEHPKAEEPSSQVKKTAVKMPSTRSRATKKTTTKK